MTPDPDPRAALPSRLDRFARGLAESAGHLRLVTPPGQVAVRDRILARTAEVVARLTAVSTALARASASGASPGDAAAWTQWIHEVAEPVNVVGGWLTLLATQATDEDTWTRAAAAVDRNAEMTVRRLTAPPD
jgi:hypothetical protein